MTHMLPEGITPDDEIEVSWAADEDGISVVTASLGDAEIVIKTSERHAQIIPWLVAAVPGILEAAWQASQAAEDSEPVDIEEVSRG